eukprot:5646245-Amphidinium_carterae.3
MEVDVKIVDVHKNTVDEVEVLAIGTVLTEHHMLLLFGNALEGVDANLEVAVEVDVEVDLLDAVADRLVDVEMLLMALALVLVEVDEVIVLHAVDKTATAWLSAATDRILGLATLAELRS